MKTDYKNLDSFETAIVTLLIVGIGLTGTIIFSGLPMQQQDNVAGALSMFDIHQQAAGELVVVVAIFDTSQEFLDQFYLAFTQVAVLPDEVANRMIEAPTQVVRAYQGFLSFSDQFATQYRNEYWDKIDVGKVAGLSVINSTQMKKVENKIRQ